MAGAVDINAARVIWNDSNAPVKQRCLAARDLGRLGQHGPNWRAPAVEDDDSVLGRVRRHGKRDYERRHQAEDRLREIEDANEKMRHLGAAAEEKAEMYELRFISVCAD